MEGKVFISITEPLETYWYILPI